MNTTTTVARVTLRRGADLTPSPWKNGGGITREIAAWPSDGALPDTFAWRASLAEIAQAGPFSRFAGVDRTLVLLDGAGLLLDETRAGGNALRAMHTLSGPLDKARFAGESGIDARLAGGPVRVFNLMVRRDAANGALEVWRTPGRCSVSGQTVLLHAAQGVLDVSVAGGECVALTAGDTLRIDAVHAVAVEARGDGAMLVVVLDPLPASGA
ncbi:histidine utilization protein HutD [Burkholderia sp. WAC0059]|uniref:HutD/Ves family protein n=1 Tax=Burkholderia sp. WAC0059 TaxID=2066022 RepID=UPI000C7ED7EF|nr:HutD family protein [Burkholderia sp. WAC0059]PLZ00161.1 histidine utilization protein HutD [Burkholderia sp. WAC0059]